MPESVRAMLALSMCPGLGPARIAALLDRFGSAEVVLGSSAAALAEVRGIGPVVAERAAAGFAAAVREAPREAERIAAAGARLVARGGAGYPGLLAPLPQAPPLLVVKGGELPEPGDRPIGIVGSRRCSSYGLEQAGRFSRALAREGSVIVSGGARGIDAASHRAALEAGGRTVVVLGCGIDRVYPPEHADLFDQIVQSGGSLVTELPCGTEPKPENFPARNRIISGMSLGVLVIEASERSGALITARLAAEEHGREVMALPGRVDSAASAGTLGLIKSGGAACVTEPGDVLAQLDGPAWIAEQTVRASSDASGPQTGEVHPAETDPCRAALVRALADAPDGLTPEDLADRAGIETSEARGAITLLEMTGRVRRVGVRLVLSR